MFLLLTTLFRRFGLDLHARSGDTSQELFREEELSKSQTEEESAEIHDEAKQEEEYEV